MHEHQFLLRPDCAAASSSRAASLPPVAIAAHRSASAPQAGSAPSAHGNTRQRGGRRGRRRACRCQQMMQCEAAAALRPPSAASRRAAATRSGVGLRSPCAPSTRWWRHAGAAACSATTARVLRTMASRISVAQSLGIGRLARLARRHVSGAKFLERLEDARLQQGQQIVQLDQVVLHRRRRQQQQEALVERVHELAALAGAVAQMMRLIDDDEIEGRLSRRSACSLRRAAPSDAIDALWLQNTVGVARAAGRRRWWRRQPELGCQLLAPLADQRCRRQHQRRSRPFRAAGTPSAPCRPRWSCRAPLRRPAARGRGIA